MKAAIGDPVTWKARDGTARSGRVSATMGLMYLVELESPCAHYGCPHRPKLEQIWDAAIVAVVRGMYNERPETLLE